MFGRREEGHFSIDVASSAIIASIFSTVERQVLPSQETSNPAKTKAIKAPGDRSIKMLSTL